MNLDKFDTTFEEYLEAITLTPTQANKIEAALKRISALALEKFADAEIYAQGSYAYDTLAKPLTDRQSGGKAGEYDIDIVIERPSWGEALASLKAVEALIEGDSVFGQMSIDKTKDSCVRVNYAPDETGVSFHIDIVPTKNAGDGRQVTVRSSNEWKPSDAKEFADTFNEFADGLPNVRPLVVILKRLRDLNDLTEDLKSVLVVTLVMQNYISQGSVMGDLMALLEEVIGIFSDPHTPPEISNPVNEGDDLAEGIGRYELVRDFFIEFNDKLARAVAEDDTDTLKELFGDGFDYVSAENNTAALGSITALPSQPARAYGGYNDATEQER